MLKTYEGLFIFPGSLKDDELEAALAKVRKHIEALGGRWVGVRPIGVRTFARRMKKRSSGHYARATFEIEPDKVARLHSRFKLDETVFRVQITLPDRRIAAEAVTEEMEPAAAEPVAAAAGDSKKDPEQEKKDG